MHQEQGGGCARGAGRLLAGNNINSDLGRGVYNYKEQWMDNSDKEREWVAGVCTEAWQKDCGEVLSAEGQANEQLEGGLKRSNSAKQQRCEASGHGRSAGLVGKCRGLVLCSCETNGKVLPRWGRWES